MAREERCVRGNDVGDQVSVTGTESGDVQLSCWRWCAHTTLYLDPRAARLLAALLQDVANEASATARATAAASGEETTA